MKKIWICIFISILLFLSYGVYISQYSYSIQSSLNSIPHNDFLYPYKGIMNVHTSLSSGSGSIPEVIEAAKKADLDFIIITDGPKNTHEQLRWEGYHDKLLVIFAEKHPYLDGKFIRLQEKLKDSISIPNKESIDTTVGNLHLTDLLSDSQSRKEDFLILAHPLLKGTEWSGEIPLGLQGLEVINLKSIWQNTWEESKSALLWTPLFYPFNPDLALIRLYGNLNKELTLWDQISKQRKFIAFAGTDAESKFLLPWNSSLNLPPYSRLFKIVSNTLILKSELTGQFQNDKEKIFDGLFNGQHYMSLDVLASAQGFRFYASLNEQIFLTGSKIQKKTNAPLFLHYTLPFIPKVPFKVMLYRNGVAFNEYQAQGSQISIQGKGSYRIAVLVQPQIPLSEKNWIPWILTNPIWVE